MALRKPTRIVHIITTLSTGGAEAMLYKLVKQTHTKKSIEQQVVSLSGIDHYGPMLKRLGIGVHRLNLSKFPQNIPHFFRLCLDMRRFKPDILMSWLYHADLFGLFVAGIWDVQRTIWNVRCSNMDLSKYNRLTKHIFYVLKKLSFIPDAIIANSVSGMDYHKRMGYYPRRFEIIPNGFETERFKPSDRVRVTFRRINEIDEDAPLVGMIARYDPMKDHSLFFKVASMISNSLQGVRFVLVGKGIDENNPDVIKMVNKNHLTEKVLLMGIRSDLNHVYPALDLLISTSAFGEGFPNVIGEAMSCGVPVVATDVGDSAYLLGNGGKIVPHGDAKEIAQTCVDLLSLPVDERKRIGFSGRERIKKHFSIDQVSRQYLDLFNNISLES